MLKQINLIWVKLSLKYKLIKSKKYFKRNLRVKVEVWEKFLIIIKKIKKKNIFRKSKNEHNLSALRYFKVNFKRVRSFNKR